MAFLDEMIGRSIEIARNARVAEAAKYGIAPEEASEAAIQAAIEKRSQINRKSPDDLTQEEKLIVRADAARDLRKHAAETVATHRRSAIRSFIPEMHRDNAMPTNAQMGNAAKFFYETAGKPVRSSITKNSRREIVSAWEPGGGERFLIQETSENGKMMTQMRELNPHNREDRKLIEEHRNTIDLSDSMFYGSL